MTEESQIVDDDFAGSVRLAFERAFLRSCAGRNAAPDKHGGRKNGRALEWAASGSAREPILVSQRTLCHAMPSGVEA